MSDQPQADSDDRAEAHGCNVEDESTGRLMTCRACAPQAEKTHDRHRVSWGREALYSPPRILRKRRRCSGHLADPHWIDAGQRAVWSSLPPNSEIGNEGWWHAVFCMDCAPADVVSPPDHQGGQSDA